VKQQYRVRKWSEYYRGLVTRGSLTVWLDLEGFAEGWTPPNGRGNPGLYSDLAIHTCLTIKTLFRLPFPAVEGFLYRLIKPCQVKMSVPNDDYLSRPVAQQVLGVLYIGLAERLLEFVKCANVKENSILNTLPRNRTGAPCARC
jgi:hypothetical protein